MNVSADRLSDPGFAAEVLHRLAEHRVPTTALTLELLEDQLAETEVISECVERLEAAGVGFAVDDFGTGYSSLAYLKRLPIGTVKIDRSFIGTVVDDAADASIVRAVLDACRATGRFTVAEGVETVEQLRLLRSFGCDAVQGALIGMPLPLELLRPLLEPAGRADLQTCRPPPALEPGVSVSGVAQVVQLVVVDPEVVRDLVDDGDPDLLDHLVRGSAPIAGSGRRKMVIRSGSTPAYQPSRSVSGTPS